MFSYLNSTGSFVRGEQGVFGVDDWLDWVGGMVIGSRLAESHLRGRLCTCVFGAGAQFRRPCVLLLFSWLLFSEKQPCAYSLQREC